MNSRYASRLRRAIIERKNWLKWQAERVADWQPKPLKARD